MSKSAPYKVYFTPSMFHFKAIALVQEQKMLTT